MARLTWASECGELPNDLILYKATTRDGEVVTVYDNNGVWRDIRDFGGNTYHWAYFSGITIMRKCRPGYANEEEI